MHDRDGVTVRAGGEAAMMQQITLQSEKDLKIMEGVAIPLSFLVLVWVFGGLVAASLPVRSVLSRSSGRWRRYA